MHDTPPSRPVPPKFTKLSLPYLLVDLGVALLDEIERLIPGNLLPRICLPALVAVALHRMQNAGVVVLVVLERDAAYAEAPLGDGMVLVALDLDEPAVLVRVELQATANRMTTRW